MVFSGFVEGRLMLMDPVRGGWKKLPLSREARDAGSKVGLILAE